MSKEHHVIYVPGLHDQWILNRTLTNLLPIFWKPQGFYPHVIQPHWEEGTVFAPKLKLVINKIDELVDNGRIVSIIGQSAGGSAALNAFCERKGVLKRAVNVTGRLRAGEKVRPTLDHAAIKSPAFKESVLLFEEQNEHLLTKEDRKRMMTIRPIWDEVVPSSTVFVEGATNLVAPMIEHSLSGALLVSVWSKTILDFLRGSGSHLEGGLG